MTITILSHLIFATAMLIGLALVFVALKVD